MRRWHHPRRWAGAAIIGLLTLASASPSWGAAPGSSRNVIIIIIDGARYSETFGDPEHRYIPHIWNDLRPQGAIHTGMYNRFQTITLGAHATMLTGGRSWIPFSNPRGSEMHQPSLPTIFEYFRAATGEGARKAWMVANNGMPDMEALTYSTHPQYGRPYRALWHRAPTDDEQVARDVVVIMDRYNPRLMMVNLHGTDRWGHANDWDMYVNRIANADRMVYQLWQAIEQHPFYAGQTTLIVTSDHGRHTTDFTGHGDCCRGCQHVMFLALGPSIQPGVQTAYPERNMEDVGPTTAWLMGFPMPHAPEGEVMAELLPPGSGPFPGPVPAVDGLAVEVATTDGAGVPQTVFRPGDTIRLEAAVRNATGEAVSVYQRVAQLWQDGRGPCPYGWWYGNQDLWVDPAATWIEDHEYPIPAGMPPAEYAVRMEVRGVDATGDAVHGETLFSFTVEAP